MQASSVAASPRPSPRFVSKSFSRFDSPSPEARSRSSSGTAQQPSGTPELSFLSNAVTASPVKEEDDIFSKEDDETPGTPALGDSASFPTPQGLEELPIEIRSLTERFLDSLSARVHPTPLSIDTLSDMFQDFYKRAESHIATHIAALSSKISRVKSPRRPLRKDGQGTGEQQMLTVEEVAERKNQRRLLELKRVALEEAVERGACEKVYTKIWHHRSAEDEEQDQKLRSRVAALSLVGIGLKDLLLSGSDDVTEEMRVRITKQEAAIKAALEPARASLLSMTAEKYPLGKLHHLNSVHKSIVETLTNFIPSTSSADEILPTLIYTLLTSPPEEINVISDMHFIQRFRTQSKLEGEAAYCLVNLEAAIGFLETVELPSLRSDELLQGPEKMPPGNNRHQRKESVPMDLGIRAASPPGSQVEAFPPFQPVDALMAPPKFPTGPSPRSSRRISDLITMQTNRLEAAGDSLRGAVRDSADQAVGAIQNTMENSFRFLFGRIRANQQEQAAASDETQVPVPKTLEDARKLVSTPNTPVVGGGDYDDLGIGGPALTLVNTNGSAKENTPAANSRVLGLFAGHRARDHSVESSRSAGSGRQVSLTTENALDHPLSPEPIPDFISKDLPPLPSSSPAMSSEPLTSSVASSGIPASLSSPSASSPLSLPLTNSINQISQHGNAAVESMRNLTNTLNPLNQFSKIGLFGRSTSSPSAPTSAPGSAALTSPLAVLSTSPVSGSGFPIPSSRLVSSSNAKVLDTIDEIRKSGAKARGKFVDCKDSKELRLGEVEELLADYKRLAGLLGKIMKE